MQKRLSLIIIIIGFCLIAGGIGSYYYEQYSNNDKLESCTALITGRVENCERQIVRHFRRHGAGWTEYYYKITYSYTVEGKEYKSRQRLTYSVEEHIDVHYDPESPQKVYIGSTPQDPFGDRRTVSVLGGWFIFIGILFRFIKPGKR